MTMLILGPNGLVKIPEEKTASCPECFGHSTTLTESHKMSCSTRRCLKCHVWVRVGHGHECLKPLDPPRTKLLFQIPVKPMDNRWQIEWRWKPKIAKATGATYNPWLPALLYGAPHTKRIATNRVAVLRRQFPGKSWRVKGYHV